MFESAIALPHLPPVNAIALPKTFSSETRSHFPKLSQQRRSHFLKISLSGKMTAGTSIGDKSRAS
ncbi:MULTISPECIES: hypothetical protein [Spirulina sp. CCY15215]|uniref:hypothetical protein n=1 Tax=Spirulina sp. CCY15215 TaxID=2767591 RepID=UPI00194E025C|nr:hypothetical protein [Spirulina major]